MAGIVVAAPIPIKLRAMAPARFRNTLRNEQAGAECQGRARDDDKAEQ